MRLPARAAAPLLLPPLLAVALVLYGTSAGIGLSTDSAAYIGAARGVLAGAGIATRSPQGTMQPMTQYGPLLPWLIAAISRCGPDPFTATRGLHALLAAANVIVVMGLVQRDTGSRGWAVAGGALVASSVPFLMPHAIVWSEPTFFLCLLAATGGLGRYLASGDRRALVAAALAVGLGTLARYAGMALIPAGIALVALRRGRPTRDTLRDAVLFAAVSSIATVGWSLRNGLTEGAAWTRELGWHPPDLTRWRRAAGTLLGWLALRHHPAGIALASGALLAGAVLARGHRGRAALGAAVPPNARVAAVFSAAQAAFLVLSMTLVDATLSLEPRLLAPAFVSAAVAAIGAIGCWSRDARWTARQRAVLAAAVAVFIAAHLVGGVAWLHDAHVHGHGFAQRAWRDSALLARVRALPPEAVVYTNGAPVIHLLLDRPVEYLPERELPMAARPNPRYDAELERMRRRLADSRGAVVYFSAIDWVHHVPDAAELDRRLGLRETYRAPDGAMYELATGAK